jgi:predicted Fe-Mo cluster-binding NifX family protein
MKIAVSAAAPDLNTDIDPRFGRCQYFIIVDSDTMEFEAVQNESMMASGGAGISAAQMIAQKGAQVVLTGNCGPNAHQTLSAAGVQVITGVSGQVKAAIEAYKNGKYKATDEPNVDAHFGSAGGGGSTIRDSDMGMGRRMGGGMGGGGGRGMGRGMGYGRGRGTGMGGGMLSSTPQATSPFNEEQELQMLKAEAQLMSQQLMDIQHRIDEIERKRK